MMGLSQDLRKRLVWLCCWVCMGLSFAPADSVAQQASRKAIVHRPMTATERQRACLVADEAWPVIRAAVTHDYDRATAFSPGLVWRDNDDREVGGPEEWKEYRGTWKAIWRREIMDSKPPSVALYRQWLGVSVANIFSCDGLSAKYAVQVKEPVNMASEGRLGAVYDADYIDVAMPVVSPDGRSALISMGIREGMGKHDLVLYIAKIGGGWRVLGEKTLLVGGF